MFIVKRRVFLFVVASLLLFTTISDALVDSESPYTGDYLLIANTDINENTTYSTGALSTEPNLMETHTPTASAEPLVNTAEVVTIDGKNLIKKDINRFRLKTEAVQSTSPMLQRQAISQAVFSVGSTISFKTADFSTDPETYSNKGFTLKYVGTYCNIWMEDSNVVNISQEQYAQIATEYDTKIHEGMMTNFGPNYDKDGDGKTAIVLMDIQDGYGSTQWSWYIGGYFHPADLDAGLNDRDMIYIDTYPAMGTDKNLPVVSRTFSTLVHEFQHLINFSDVMLNNRSEQMPVWLDEGLSMAAEHMVYGAKADRISYYNSSSYIKNGQSLFYWGDNNNVLSNYSLSYLFVQYLKTQTKVFLGGGEAIYKKLIQNNNRTATVVQEVMREFYPSITLEDILKNFRIATVLKEPTGPYGFWGESAFEGIIPQYYTGGSKSLRGGSAIIRQISAPFTPSGNDAYIQFVGFQAEQVSAPTMSTAATTIVSGTQITLSSTTSGATIRYTTDGTTPTSSSGTVYTSPIPISQNSTLKALAYKTNMKESLVATVNYNVVIPPQGTVIKPLAIFSQGLYNGVQAVHFPQQGTFTVKAQYANYTSSETNATFFIAVKEGQKLKQVYVIPKNIKKDEVLFVEQDIIVTSSTTEVKIFAWNNSNTIKPLAMPVAVQ